MGWETRFQNNDPSYLEPRISNAESSLAEIAYNVKLSGAVGNANFYNSSNGKWYADSSFTVLAHDDSAAIIDACSKYNNIYFPDGNYLVYIPTPTVDRTALYEFNNRSNIRLTGKGATIIDGSTYSANVLTDIFRFITCTDIYVDINYNAIPIANPNTNLGYWGSSFLYFENMCDHIKVDSIVKNCRYGVRSGGYSIPSYGYCSNFNITLKTYMTGYPTALYLASNIKGKITANGFHRATYLAGVIGAKYDIQFQNQYIVDTIFLLTDAKTGTGTSRGCSNIKANLKDTGSTIFQPSSSCAGIGLSHCDPNTIYSDIDIHVNVVGTDTIATTIGGFKVYSSAKTFDPSYAYNFENYIYLKNIKISGFIDRTNQTLAGNTSGEIYFYAEDTYQHFATVSNINFSDLTIIPSSGDTRHLYFYARGLTDRAVFSNVSAYGKTLEMVTNNNSRTLFLNSKLSQINGFQSTMSFENTHVDTVDSLINSTTINSTISGGGSFIQTVEKILTLSGATTTWSTAIPKGSLVLGLSGRVTQDITGATGYTVGVTGDTSRYVNTNNIVNGSTFTPAQIAATEIGARVYPGNTDLIVTAKTSNFTGGTLKLQLVYITFNAMTL